TLINFSRYWPIPRVNVADRDYFKALRSDPNLHRFISEPVPNRGTGTLTIYMARRVSGPNGEFLGLILGAVEMTYFQNLYASLVQGAGRTIALFRTDGTLLARYPDVARTLGQNYSATDVFRRLEVAQGRVLVRQVSQVDGQDRLIAAQKLGRLPMAVTTSQTVDSVLSSWRKLVVVLLAAALFLEAMLIAIAGMLWRQFRQQRMLAMARVAQVLAERTTLAAAAELELLNASMPAVLTRFGCGPDGLWESCYTAPSAEAVFGFPLAVARRPGWLQSRLSADDLAQFHQQIEQALAHGTGQMEIGFEHAAGGIRRLSGAMRPIMTPQGNVDVIIVWTDVTRERALAGQLAEAAKLATLGEVATGMAHELNQPLATISMAAENLTRAISRLPDMSPRLVQKLTVITDQAIRASAIIDHMRVFGRAGSAAPEALHLTPLLDALPDLTASKLHGSGAHLILDVPDDLPAFMAGALALEQVLVNLIGNACDAYLGAGVSIGARERVIRIGAAFAEGRVCITVSDRAGGISEDAMPRIFEPFFTTKAVGKGTGLGLSISYGLITEMGGSITAENQGGGAHFTIRLAAASGEFVSKRQKVAV
ncbi:MAG: ATP-binding protein, partial [Roseococcus sp.]